MLLLAFVWIRLESTLPIFAVLAALGIARAFQLPATQAFVPTIVPAEALRNALAVNSSANQVATIVGPSAGGLLYVLSDSVAGAVSGAERVYGVAAILLLVAIGMVAMVHKRRAPSVRVGPTWASLLQGVRFILHRKTVLGAISLDLFAVLFGGATALLPAFTRDVLHAGPEVFGYLRAAPGIGAGATALWLAFRPISRHVGVTMFAGVAAFGAATMVFGLTRSFWVAVIALVILGVGDMINVFIRSMLVQLNTPDEIRGRVSAVNAVFVGASNELGEFESGFTAAWFGLVPAIVLGGAATLLITVLWARVLFPALWRMQTFEQVK